MAAKSTAAPTIARIAGRQHGSLTRGQLLRAGLTNNQINARVANGMLIRVHRGVYRVGHTAPSVEANYMAAVLACGVGAVLAGRAAAHLLGLTKGKAPPAEVLVAAKRRGARRGKLDPSDRTRWHGIPVTTPARTLLDLAPHMTVEELALAAHNAGVRHHLTPRQVKEVLARRPNAPGASKFRPIFEGDAPAILSWMERRALAAVASSDLPKPAVNRRMAEGYVDLRWPGLTVELQSYRFHHSRHAWERDHDRRRAARGRGDEFRTYTYEDVLEGRAMVKELRALLATGPSAAPAARRRAA
jgi:hypothetical protein